MRSSDGISIHCRVRPDRPGRGTLAPRRHGGFRQRRSRPPVAPYRTIAAPIALAGLAAQTGTVMIIYLDEAFHAYQKAGRMKTQYDLFESITYGAVQRVRPKLMTVSMITLGLVPALWAHGAGAEAIQRIAAPMIGGLITSTILTLEIVPAIYSIWRGRHVEWVKGPPPPRKSWDQLSEIFVDLEKKQHAERLGGPAR